MLGKRRKESSKLEPIPNEQILKELVETGKCIHNEFTMKHDHIRMLVYVEKASKLRFDSDTIRFADNSSTEPSKLNFFAQKSDTPEIGELIFGNAQHMIESGSFKIHHIYDKLMISRMFSIPREKDIGLNDYNLESDVRSAVQMWDTFIRKEHAPLQRHYSYFNTEPPDYLRKVSKARMSTMSRVPLRSDECSISCGSSRRLGSTLKGLNSYRHTAIAIVFDNGLEEFVFNNLHFIDREMKDLQQSLFDSLCKDKKLFHFKTAVACQKFRENLVSLHNAMRLNSFIASSLKTPKLYDEMAVNSYFQDFNEMINIFETKETGYFLSKLISAVMMYHLTWVLTTDEVFTSKHEGFWTLSEYYQNQSRPLMNAMGCIGALSHTTRLVLVGENVKHVAQLLHVLTYFLRIDRMHFDQSGSDSHREPNYSLNNIWPFTKAEMVAQKVNNNNPVLELNRHNDEMEKIADRWQLGEFGAMLAQKQKLREQFTSQVWSTKYDLTDGDCIRFPRHRTKSEPQPRHIEKDSNVRNFRPRSSSNPISRFKMPKRKSLLKPDKKPKVIIQTEFTTPKGKLPYGFTLPFEKPEPKKKEKIIKQKYDAKAVWNESPQRSPFDLSRHHHNRNDGQISHFDSGLPSTSSDYTISDKSRPISPRQSSSALSPTSSTTSLLSNPSLASYIYEPIQPSKPIRAKRRKSKTSLARVLAKNCVYVHDPTNPLEEEELYEHFLQKLLHVEYAMDDFGDHLSNGEECPRVAVLKKLFGGILNDFQPAFIMQGINATKLANINLLDQIKKEVQHPESFYITIPKNNENEESPRKSTKIANIEKREVEYIQMTSVIIVANLDDHKITIHSGDVHTYLEEEMAYPCDIVQTMVENVRDMCAEKDYTNELILCTLKERFENLVRRASQLHYFIQSLDTSEDEVFANISNKISHEAHLKLIKELMDRHNHAEALDPRVNESVSNIEEKIDASSLVKLLNCEYSDLRLLINICSVLSPLVRAALS